MFSHAIMHEANRSCADWCSEARVFVYYFQFFIYICKIVKTASKKKSENQTKFYLGS